MCYALEPLRAAGIRLVYYLNDIYALAKTKEEMKFHSQTGLAETYARILGFTFNTKAMKASVPQSKLTKLTTRIKPLQEKALYFCRWIARLRQDDINNTSNWQSTAIYQISSERPDKEPSSTAPELKEEETDLSIDVKELKIIEFALQLHAREFEGALIKIFSDNIMALNRSIKWQEKAAVRMETTIQVLQDDARNLGSSKVRCLRNESEHISTLALESEPRPTSRSDQCMEQRVEGNRPIFAPILETSTKSTTKNEDRQRQESCVDRTKLAKPVLVTDGPKTKLSPANELQDLQTMVLDCMAIIRWYQAKKQNLKSVSVEYS
ncbi:hypothetical protein G6F43_001557 [Rhizopus delemar]|nr:hypothetical protein G6F43_001557 [Rhizopus delemar]